MTIFDSIKKDHRKHRELLERLAESSGDSQARQKAWQQFYYEAKAHAAAEEETFYASLIATENGQPDSRHAIHEHYAMDKQIDELNQTDMSSPAWLARFKELRDAYEHHMEEEETDIFKRARAELKNETASQLAESFEARKSKELALVEWKTDRALEEH